MDKKNFVKYLRTLGIEVHTTTKARGHQGFYINNRIDISKNTPDNRVIPTLIHEFAHYIHHEIEPDMPRTGGNLEVLFKSDCAEITKELFRVTNFVDENSLCVRLYEHKDRIRAKIFEYEEIIKRKYPRFLRSKKFKEFESYIKHSDAKYLVKYDRVKVINGIFSLRPKIYSIDTIETSFPKMPEAFVAYIRLKSCMRKQSRITARINKLNRYYKRPAELFARFVEGLYLDREWVEAVAPVASEKFYELLQDGYYGALADVIKIC